MIFYSHADENGNPQKELKVHLKEVGIEAKNYIRKIPLPDKELLGEIAYLVGISHDFGKYTSFFQEHLLKKINYGIKSHHSFISALFAAWQVQKYLEEIKLGKDVYSYLPLVAYFVVLHHHGDLGSLEVDIPTGKHLKNPPEFPYADPILRERLKVMYEQVKDLKKRLKDIEKDYSEMGVSDFVDTFLNSWLGILKNLVKFNRNFKNTISDEEKTVLPFITMLLYSVLIDADKRDAGEVSTLDRKSLPYDIVDRYREKHFNLNSRKPMDLMRNEIYEKAIRKIEKISLKNRLFTLTAPTGSGKTLTAFSAALRLRERVRKTQGYIPRIIYSLPFITIIEQNYKVIRDVLLSEIRDFEENETAYLLKHHHLTDLEYKEGKEDKPIDEALLLIESWESEIIVTTFVQFLHTIIGFKNGFLKKYHNIAGSIILLDEVQNIPIKYWELIGKVIKMLSDYWGCYFILLTATKPLILKDEDVVPLVDDSEIYFRQLNRVIIKPCTKKRNIDEFIECFKSVYDSESSYLIVANTIRSSKEIYEMIKNCNLSSYLFYLSTNIIPKQRIARIKALKNLLDAGDKPIVVSTQVIEAGVDLDFDTVIRDIGPIDSIIQVAGRCNREFNKTQKEVYVFCLDNFSYYVYGKIHPDISKDLLGKQELQESNFYQLIYDYFKKVKPKINDDDSKHVWEAMRDLRFYERHSFQKTVSSFHLIDEKGEYIDIFIEIDNKARRIWEEYCNRVYNEKNFIQRKYNYLSIRKEFRNYVISIRKNKNIVFPPKVCGLHYVSQEQLGDFYSRETGFKTDVDTLIW